MRCLVLVVVASVLCACDRKAESPSATPRVLRKLEDVRGTGIVKGRVKLDGVVPEMRVIENKPCHHGAEPIREETVEVGATGGLKNVIVSIESPTIGAIDGSGLPQVMLDQRMFDLGQ